MKKNAKVKIVLPENGEDKACFKKINGETTSNDSIDKQNDWDVEIHDIDQEESASSFDSVMKFKKYLITMTQELLFFAYYLNHIVIGNLM